MCGSFQRASGPATLRQMIVECGGKKKAEATEAAPVAEVTAETPEATEQQPS